jgi:acetyl-CoA carboxylase biotin carboxyl carrier protein
MTLDDLRQILDLVREHDLAEFELELEGTKLRLRKASAGGSVPMAAAQVAPAMGVVPAFAPAAAPAPAPASADPAEDEGLELALVTSPIVGTFYRAPSPEAPSFVEIGSRVRKGQALCIIEAMKLMNEIESDFDGEVVKIFVDNGQPVQFGERLFAIRRV